MASPNHPVEKLRQEDAPFKTAIPELDKNLFMPTDVEREFLKSSLSSDEQVMRERLYVSQQRLYLEHPYPCIHSFAFVSLMMLKNLVYDEVLRDGRDGETRFLDVGCCNVRKLVADGYPANNVFACELRRSFIDLGYELFNDLNSSNIHFFDGDIFTLPVKIESPTDPDHGTISPTQTWSRLLNKVDHIYAGALFHLFDESTQVALARRLTILSTRSRGAVIFGRHQGRDVEGLLDDHLGRVRYGHSPATWKRMWSGILSEFGVTNIKATAGFDDQHDEKTHLIPKTSRMMYWSVHIL